MPIKPYIYQKPDWPTFRWSNEELITPLAKARNLQGNLVGKMQGLGFDLQNEAVLETITQDVIKSTEIEGEKLDPNQVRSSVARRLGMQVSGMIKSDHNVEGAVEMLMDATQNFDEKLTKVRLYGWQNALFPGGMSGINKISVGKWRDDKKGPMIVVSGPIGKEKIHFEAIAAEKLPEEMKTFLKWFNDENSLDPFIKAGIAHLWFETLHPFDDGNGRVGRALIDLLLARADDIPKRYYSMSSQIKVQKNEYESILEKSQQGTLDITKWLLWFVQCLQNSLQASDNILVKVLYKHKFWSKHNSDNQNARQRKILNMLLDNFDGKLTTKKWGKICKCSHDTALRDIQSLIEKKILQKEKAGGRSTNYELVYIK